MTEDWIRGHWRLHHHLQLTENCTINEWRIHIRPEWLSRNNLSSPLFARVTYRHVKNWFTHLLDRSQTISCLDSKLFFKTCIYEQNISIYDIYTSQWPFYCLTFKCDLDLQLTWTNVSNEQPSQIILKSMHKCTSYALDKLNSLSFYHLTFKCNRDLQRNWTTA